MRWLGWIYKDYVDYNVLNGFNLEGVEGLGRGSRGRSVWDLDGWNKLDREDYVFSFELVEWDECLGVKNVCLRRRICVFFIDEVENFSLRSTVCFVLYIYFCGLYFFS